MEWIILVLCFKNTINDMLIPKALLKIYMRSQFFNRRYEKRCIRDLIKTGQYDCHL